MIFVHGFRGSYVSTWGGLPDYLLNQTDSQSSKSLAEWDYLFIGYETYSIGTYLDIADLVASQWAAASAGNLPFSNPYSHLALVGHSLGTLGIRQLLCALTRHPPGMLEALHATLLLGSPINGSGLSGMAGLAKVGDFVKGKFAAALPSSYKIAGALEPDGAPIRMLHAWNAAIRGMKNMKSVSVVLGADDLVVPQGKMVKWDGDVETATSLDHSELCKVEYNGAATSGALLDRLTTVLSNA